MTGAFFLGICINYPNGLFNSSLFQVWPWAEDFTTIFRCSVECMHSNNLALETAEFYGISIDIAKKSISKMREIINEHWKKLARKYGLSRNAIEYMRPAFDMRLKE